MADDDDNRSQKRSHAVFAEKDGSGAPDQT